ncbi:MAG: acyl-CoA dehydrogenase family protein [Bdellovibrionales bacterium]|nr:acyl-CoA dehydrogenase family protein [Bdellovibrionales bacterium]
MDANIFDFYQIDDFLSEEEKMIRHEVKKFVDQEIMPNISQWHIDGHFPKHLIKQFAELGLLGSSIQGYDCPGLSYTAYGVIMQEIERADSGLRSFTSVQSSLCMYPIFKFATEEIKKQYLPKMAKGELIGCFGLTEPDYGSNPSGMLTRAKKEGSHYILNGNKMWITNGDIADLAIVWAKGDDNKIIGLVVDKDLPGFKTQTIDKKYSLRASNTSELIFENCKVPASHVLDVKGLKGPFSCLNMARYGISWGSIGAAQACFEEALNYSKTRIQFDKPIAGFQLVQAKLVKMFTEITKMQLLSWRLGGLLDRSQWIPQQISMAKMNNVSNALEIARNCRDILGANGITHEYHVGRHMMNLESVNTYEGTEDIHRLILGQYITGLPAFS